MSQKDILDLFKNNKTGKGLMSKGEIYLKNRSISPRAISQNLNRLCKYGFLEPVDIKPINRRFYRLK